MPRFLIDVLHVCYLGRSSDRFQSLRKKKRKKKKEKKEKKRKEKRLAAFWWNDSACKNWHGRKLRGEIPAEIRTGSKRTSVSKRTTSWNWPSSLIATLALMTENLGGAYTPSRLSNGVSLTTVGLSLENNVCCHCIFVALSDSVFVGLVLLVIGWNCWNICKLPFQGIGLMACSCCIHASLHGGVNAPCQRGMPLPPGRSWSALIADNGCRWFP